MTPDPPKPYYVDEWVTLYLGDCREVLPTLGERFDAAVVDPPYGETVAELEAERDAAISAYEFAEGAVDRLAAERDRLADTLRAVQPVVDAAKEWRAAQREPKYDESRQDTFHRLIQAVDADLHPLGGCTRGAEVTQPDPRRRMKLTPRGVLAGAALAALESSELAETVPLLPRLDVILLIVDAVEPLIRTQIAEELRQKAREWHALVAPYTHSYGLVWGDAADFVLDPDREHAKENTDGT